MKAFFWMLAFAVALGFSGCARYTWEKPGGTAAEFEKDKYACERDARMASAPFNARPANPDAALAFSDSMTAWNVFYRTSEQCMRAQGYVKRPIDG